jgi:hypothetical protein
MDPLGDDRMGACHSAKLNVSFEPQVLAGKFLLSQKLLVLQERPILALRILASPSSPFHKGTVSP